MIYNTDNATSINQESEIAVLTQILTAVQMISPDDSAALVKLQAILDAFAPLATSAKQDTGNTSLASILSALGTAATAANQVSGNASLTAILAAFGPLATAAAQATGNASLASIDAKLSSSTGAITSVSQSTSTVLLLPTNVNRKGFMLYNDSGQKAYVAFAATSTTTAFSVLINANAGYESNQPISYRGAVSAIWSGAGGGAMRITELT